MGARLSLLSVGESRRRNNEEAPGKHVMTARIGVALGVSPQVLQ
jgi:hypothetical protein